MSRTTVTEWKRAVFRSPRLTDPARVVLLYLSEHMRSDRRVSVPRATIARALGKSERRVSERIREGREAGFLSIVSAGYRGHVPEYQGILPALERVSSTSTLSRPESVTLSTLKRGTPGGPTITRADLSPVAHDHNVSNDEERPDTPAAYGLTVCDCHGFTDCVSLDRARTREESA